MATQYVLLVIPAMIGGNLGQGADDARECHNDHEDFSRAGSTRTDACGDCVRPLWRQSMNQEASAS